MSTSQNVEHYGGPGNIPPSVAVALQEEQDQRTQSCPEKFCFYPVSHDRLCWQVITCQSLPGHMRSKHGVYAKPENEHDQYTYCRWDWCPKRISRHNIYRHFTESHLGHRRGSGHS